MRYLLDTMILKEIGKSEPHRNVSAWLATVDDLDLTISVISLREIWTGIERKRVSDTVLADALEAAANRILAAFAGRIVPIDAQVAVHWGTLLGRSEKHVNDTGLAATACVHGMVLVTRNMAHVHGRGVESLDPFRRPARLQRI